ncbi:Serine/threonine-protein kinase ULK2 [Mizuhopecten yessoensis]|uniref:non-specific serine/threonine protein kinase n=1 Tax=Mizuhopecten yessoensis TaxID=6573 RepID=A0A210R3A0_MIZYE|nr:Serine/threonine-protein kinase ULK2 [Mizuhopecten yessoensis]
MGGLRISMVVPCVTTTHLTEDKLDEIMAVQADQNDFTSHTTTDSNGLNMSVILKDVMDMENEVEERKIRQEAELRDPSSFEDLKTKFSSSKHQVYHHTGVNLESDVDTSDPLDSEWEASIQMRNCADMVQTRDDEYKNKLLRNARKQNQSQAVPWTSDHAAPLKDITPVQELGKRHRVTVFENATTKSLFVQKQYLEKPNEREIEVLRAMKHRNIPTLYNTGMQGNSTILQMEYCGEPLAKYVEKNFNKGRYVPETFMWNILEQIMDLLRFLEYSKVVHQNISAETICLLHTRKGLVVKLVGFGNVLTYQDLVPQSGIQSTAALGGTVQYCEADDLAKRTLTLSGRSLLGMQWSSEASLTDDMVPWAGAQRGKSSSGSDKASRPSCQADMVASGRVALFMVYGPGVKDLSDKCFPNSSDLKDFVLKMVDLNPQTGLKPAAGLDIIQKKLSQDVIELSDSDEVIELPDSDEAIELSGSDEAIELSGSWEGAVEPSTNEVTAYPTISVSTPLTTPLQQETFSFRKNGDSRDLPLITPPTYQPTSKSNILTPSSRVELQAANASSSLVGTAGTVGSSIDRPDDVISVNPGSSLYKEPDKETPRKDMTQSQADKGTLNKLRSRVTWNKGSRDKPYIRPQTKFTNLPNFEKLE